MIRFPPPGYIIFALLLFVLLLLYIDHRVSTLALYGTPKWRDREGEREGLAIIVYNRVPKTGSTTFTNAIAYDMYEKNGFHVIHLNLTKNRQVMSLPDQMELVRNVSEWRERHPLFLHGHVAYLDFERFGYPRPLYINIVREPLERLLSHYYFLRYGDTYRVGLKRARDGNNETFDQCVERNGKDCDSSHMWMQIPYFCGHHHFCSTVGSKEALDEAKKNLIEKYFLVGPSERMRDMIGLLDASLPSFFRGTLQHFDELDEKRSHLRNTKKKVAPSPQTVYLVHSTPAYKMESEFYKFAVAQFDAIFKQATNGTGKIETIPSLRQQFHFEKIKPPPVGEQ